MKENNLDLLVSHLTEATDWLSAGELAVLLHTTPRTIRNYVKELNHDAGGAPRVISGPKGYRWNLEPARVSREDRPLPQTPQERRLYILRKLLYYPGIGSSQFSEELMVSERTIQLDFDQIRPLLRQYDLSLRQKQEVIHISGKETDIRRFAFHCIALNQKARLFTMELLQRSFPQFDVPALDKSLLNVLSQYRLSLNAYCHCDLLLRLLIQIARLQCGSKVQQDEVPVQDVRKTPDYQAAERLAAELSAPYGIEFDPFELDYLSALLLSKADYAGNADFLNGTAFSALPENIEYVLDILHRRVGADFTGRRAPDSLIHYFHRLIVRSTMHLPTFDPLSNALRISEPCLYNCAAWAMTQFILLYHITPADGEVGFLTLILSTTFGNDFDKRPPISYTLICPEFWDLSHRLTDALDRKFEGRLQPAAIVTTITDTDLPPSDLCLSILPLKNQRQSVHISPLLSDADCDAIRRKINKLDRIRYRNFLRDYVTCYSCPEFFERDRHFDSAEDTIHYICERLQAQDAVDERFEQTVTQRELADSTAFSHLVALPHACLSSVKRNSLYILLNREPISWGNTSVNLVMLMALQRDLLADFRLIYSLLIDLFSHPKSLSAILQATDLDSFVQSVSEISLE